MDKSFFDMEKQWMKDIKIRNEHQPNWQRNEKFIKDNMNSHVTCLICLWCAILQFNRRCVEIYGQKKSTYTLHHSNIIFSYADKMHWTLFELQTPRNCLASIWIFIVLPIFLLSHMHHDHIHMNECWTMSMWHIIYIYRL